MVHKALLIGIVVVVVFVGIIFAFAAFTHPLETPTPNTSTAVHANHCASVMPPEQSQALIDRLDRSESGFASTSRDVMGQTTEGGEQTTYTQDGLRQIVEQRFYGETGRSIARIYYTSGKPFALIVQSMKYAVPLSVDNSGAVQSTEQRMYFIDDHGVVCSSMLNGKPQPVDDNTIGSVKTYLTGVL